MRLSLSDERASGASGVPSSAVRSASAERSRAGDGGPHGLIRKAANLPLTPSPFPVYLARKIRRSGRKTNSSPGRAFLGEMYLCDV